MSVGWVFVCCLALGLADCTLPTFGTGVVGSGLCVSGGVLPAAQSCNVTCNSNYTASGTNTYTCTGTTLSQTATLTCALSCFIVVPPYLIGAGPNPCPQVGPLARNTACNVTCDTANGFNSANTGSMYSCDNQGRTTNSTTRCTPCLLPQMTPNNDLTSGCQSGQRLNASTSCNVVCNSNYTVSGGSSQFTCSGTGTLSTSSVTCQAVNCAFPTANSNVVRGGCAASIPANTSCTAQCASGYVTESGSGLVTCVSRIANSPSLVCAPGPCNVSIIGFTGVTTDSCVLGSMLPSGQSCTLKCLSGYMPQGPAAAQCSAGTFSVSIDCQPASCVVPALEMGVTIGNNNPRCNPGGTMNSGSNCNLACATGYSPTGDKSFSCNMGAITTTVPYPPWCSPNPCTVPNFPPNMVPNPTGSHNAACTASSSLSSSAVCDVTCGSGFTPSTQGTYYYSCFAGSFVAQPTGQCLPPGGCFFPPLGTGYVNGSCDGQPLANGSSCTVNCDTGYSGNASLSNSFTCLNGILTPPPRTCTPSSCSLPAMGPGVTGCVSNGVLASGQSCTMGCGAGSILASPSQNGSQYQCSYGTLTQSPSPFTASAFCEVGGCIVPPTPAGYAYTGFFRCVAGSVLADGSTCAGNCAASYSGSGNFVCTNGTVAPNYNCTASDCRYNVPPTPNTAGWLGNNAGVCNQSCALASGFQTLSSGACCEYTCAPGYTFAGGTLRYDCQVPPPNCGFFCDATPNAANLVCNPNPCTLPTTLGAGLDFGTCVSNGTLTGSGTGSSCTVACASTHYLSSGTTSYSCSLGNLTAATAVCLPRNCSLPASFSSQQFVGAVGGPNNNDCSVNEVLGSGAACDVSCPANFTSNGGTAAYSCLYGQRTDPTLVCTASADCALPTSFSPSMVPGAPTPCSLPGFLTNGTRCDVGCKAGFSASVGSTSYSCSNGTLSSPTLVCVPNACNVTLTANETGGNCTTLPSGTSCVSGCATGFTAKTITRSCYLGNLTTVGGNCTPAPCQLPLTFSEGVRGTGGNGCVANSQLTSGSNCDVTCSTGYTLNGTGTQYSCSLGNLTNPGINCLPARCLVPTVTGQVGDNSTGKACIPGQYVAHGDYCLWACDSANNYQGGAGYASNCSYGSFSSTSASCTNQYACVLPSFGPYVVPTSCGSPGDTLNYGATCNVACDTTGLFDVVGATGQNRFRFTCGTGGQFAPAYTYQCVPLPCSLPYDLGANTTNGTCVAATRLDSGSSCTVACASGYSMSPANALSYTCEAGILTSPGTCIRPTECAVPSFVNSHYAGASQGDVFACAEGQALTSGSKCNVGCVSTFTPNAGTTVFSCNAGVLTSPTLVCTGPPCTLLNFTTSGYSSAQCVSGGTLAYGSSCTVSCAAPGYNATNTGTTQFVCGTTLTRPSLRCAAVPCKLPDALPSSLSSGSCSVGGTLAVGSGCNVACASSYSSNGTGTNRYQCDAGTPFGAAPVLSAPTFQCTANRCSLPSPMLAGYVTTGCAPNSVAANCSAECAQGFNSVVGGVVQPVVASCPANGGQFVFTGCSADLPCNINPKAGYNITCVGPITPGNCTGTVCTSGYYGTPILGCSRAGNAMSFTGCTACLTTCPAGRGSSPCNTTYQSPCTNCSANTYNNGTTLACLPCPPSKCSAPGSSVCDLVCPLQEASKGDSISDGALAAAIIVPLLVVALVVLAIWNWKRQRKGSVGLAKSEKAHGGD